LNVWHERLLEFDYQPLSERRIVAYYALSPSLAGSKSSRTLRECFVICVEPARESIGWNGGPAIGLNSAATEIREYRNGTNS
jgi:hypothetical protein